MERCIGSKENDNATVPCSRLSQRARASVNRGGVTTQRRPVSGEKQNSFGNLEILPGIGRLGNFSGKYDIVQGY